MLGQEQDCLGGCFNPMEALDGAVDEFSIYDRALSDQEILAIFEANEAGKCKPPSHVDLQDDVAQLESQLESLLDVISDLEATAEEANRHPCQNSHRKRGCWKHRSRHHER